MASWRGFFPNPYLAADDLVGGEATHRIAAVEGVTLGRGKDAQSKLLVRLSALNGGPAPKPLVCNRTNASAIASLFGDDVQGWIGQPITLYRAMVDFAGRTTPAIRVRADIAHPQGEAATRQSVQPAPAPRRNGNGHRRAHR